MAADPTANPTANTLDDYIDAVASALALPVEDAWRPAVRANLEVSLRLARLVDEFRVARRNRAGQCLHSLIAP